MPDNISISDTDSSVESISISMADEDNSTQQIIISDNSGVNSDSELYLLDSDYDVLERRITALETQFVFEQAEASDTWDIQHNLNKYPNVVCVDSFGKTFTPAWDYPELSDGTLDKNRVIVTMNGATTGKAFLY